MQILIVLFHFFNFNNLILIILITKHLLKKFKYIIQLIDKNDIFKKKTIHQTMINL